MLQAFAQVHQRDEHHELARGHANQLRGHHQQAVDRDVIQEVTVLLVGPYKHSEADEETLQRLLGAALVLLNGIADIAQASTRATAKALGDWEANLQRRPFRQNGRR